MAELVLHTHYLPRHWRGRAHSAEVQQAVSSMFTFKVLLFAEELASVVLTPFILAFSLPNCAGAGAAPLMLLAACCCLRLLLAEQFAVQPSADGAQY